MKGFLCTATFLLLGSLAGCGSAKLFKGEFQEGAIPESTDVAAAPWPALVDTPQAPPRGEYGPGVPDPAQGTAVEVELTEAAREAEAKAAALAPPPLTEADKARLKR